MRGYWVTQLLLSTRAPAQTYACLRACKRRGVQEEEREEGEGWRGSEKREGGRAGHGTARHGRTRHGTGHGTAGQDRTGEGTAQHGRAGGGRDVGAERSSWKMFSARQTCLHHVVVYIMWEQLAPDPDHAAFSGVFPFVCPPWVRVRSLLSCS